MYNEKMRQSFHLEPLRTYTFLLIEWQCLLKCISQAHVTLGPKPSALVSWRQGFHNGKPNISLVASVKIETSDPV